ncbi:MAG: glycosyltransferase [Planctomycetota bacterium]
MNLLLITSTYPTPNRPRQGAFNSAMVQSLRSRHQVRVIAPIPWTQSTRAALWNHLGEDIEGTIHPTFLYPPKVLRHHYGSFYWRSIRPALCKLKSEGFRPDAVMGYWLHPDGEAALRAANFFGVPGLVISGGSDLLRLPSVSLRRKAITRVLRQADRIIVVSRDLQHRAVALGASADRVHLVRRGVRQDLFFPTDRTAARRVTGLSTDSIVLTWAGRLEPVKNPAMLLYAAKEWHRRWGDRLRVQMFGDGSMRSELLSLRQSLGLRETVEIRPSISQSDLALRYQSSDLTVLTSHSEGVPNVLLESLACNVPFAATDVGGVSEIATTGIDALVGDGNIQQLVESVIHQIENAAAKKAIKRRFVPQGLDRAADQMEQLLLQDLPTHRDRALPTPLAVPSMTESQITGSQIPGSQISGAPTAGPSWAEAIR